MKKFRIIIECTVPEDIEDSRAHCYASSMLDHVKRPFWIEGIGYSLHIDDVLYEFEKPTEEIVERSQEHQTLVHFTSVAYSMARIGFLIAAGYALSGVL